MPFEHRVKVRYGETDQMGVVHHANHLLYLEEARTEYLASLGYPYPEVERSGIGLPVRGLEVRYRSPALYGDELVVELGVDSVRAASVRFTYRLSRADGGEAVADATVASGASLAKTSVIRWTRSWFMVASRWCGLAAMFT